MTVQARLAESTDSSKSFAGKWVYKTEAQRHANSRAKVII